jgi:hypothetical protein
VDVTGYATRYRFDSLPESAVPLEVVYPNGLALIGYRLPQREFTCRDLRLHPPSTWIPVALYWSVDHPLGTDIRVSVSLEDGKGNVWGGGLPRENGLRGFYAPPHWQSDEVIRWDFDVVANPQTPSGDYKLVLRVAEASSGVLLPHTAGEDWAILDRVQLE